MNRMILSVFLVMAISAVPAGPGETLGSAAAMVPDTLRDDFETGEMNAWESYPIAEDPGFDPEIWCVPEPAFGGSAYSLCKVIEPNDTDWPRDENLVGMTKKIRLWTRGDTELRLAAFAEGDRKPEEIRVVLYGADGRRYTWSQVWPQGERVGSLCGSLWPISGPRGGPLEPGMLLEAVTVLVRYDAGESPPELQPLPRRFQPLRRAAPAICRGGALLHVARQILLHFPEPSLPPRRDHLPESVRRKQGGRAGRAGIPDRTVSAIPAERFAIERRPLPARGENGVWNSGRPVPYRRQGSRRAVEARRWKGQEPGGSGSRDELFFIVPERRFTPAEHPRLFFTAGDLRHGRAARWTRSGRESWMRPWLRRGRRSSGAISRRSPSRSGISPEFLDGGPVSPSWDYYQRWCRPGRSHAGHRRPPGRSSMPSPATARPG